MATTVPEALYLSPDQQDLLLAALTSNSSSSPMFNTPSLSHRISQTLSQNPRSLPPQSHGTPESMGSQYGNGTPPPTAALSGGFPDGTPIMGDYPEWDNEVDVDGNWDYDLPLGGIDKNMDSISYAGTPISISNSAGDKDGEKRKTPPDVEDGSPSVDPHDTEPKRRESDDKVAKKPGRKPLTSEPTSKRKAQNRAAQRAFRERKEKHLKDLEEKVSDLEKASESANHENSRLRAQVEHLQLEVKEYRRRLHATGQGGSPPSASTLFPNRGRVGNGGFQFEFPAFGNPLFLRQDSADGGGPKLGSGTLLDRLNASNGTLPAPQNGLQGPANGAGGANGYGLHQDHSSSAQNTPRLNGGRDYASSPSASSVSQHGSGSSAGTSPEPTSNTADSKITTAPNGDKYICKSGPLDGETETTFCEKLGMACGNPNNPIPKASRLAATPPTANSATKPPTDYNTDPPNWLSQQNGGIFDPVFFGDYRDPINDINSGINMSYFDDASFTVPAFADLGSPLNLAHSPNPPNDQDSDQEDEEEEVVPADDPKQMLSCNKIWDRISSHPQFASGNIDMDGLCVELRSKAKCSETGVVVAETDVQEVLTKVGVAPQDILD